MTLLFRLDTFQKVAIFIHFVFVCSFFPAYHTDAAKIVWLAHTMELFCLFPHEHEALFTAYSTADKIDIFQCLRPFSRGVHCISVLYGFTC